jgi:hypothetical protein
LWGATRAGDEHAVSIEPDYDGADDLLCEQNVRPDFGSSGDERGATPYSDPAERPDDSREWKWKEELEDDSKRSGETEDAERQRTQRGFA